MTYTSRKGRRPYQVPRLILPTEQEVSPKSKPTVAASEFTFLPGLSGNPS